MLTIKVQTVKAAAEKYFDDHLAKGEFVSEGEAQNEATGNAENLVKYYTDQPVTWNGKTAEMLGLKVGGIVTKEQFSLLLENKNPITGKSLTARTKEGRRLYFDATVSAPKSVSVMAITMGDLRLMKAHEEATKEALKDLEHFAQTRVRKDGQNALRKTHNFLTASVTHSTSRANDPQLHTHNLIFNVTWDENEKKFKALEAYEIYNNVEYFTEQYRNILAHKVMALGYQIERAKYGWELKGVSKEVCDLFSKRSAAIKEAELTLEAARGRPITNRERAILTEQTRKKKSKNLTLEMAVEHQKSELTKEQLQDLEYLLGRSKELGKSIKKDNENLTKLLGPIKEGTITQDEINAVDFAVQHIFERQSTVSKNELISLAIKSSYGNVNLKAIEKVLEKKEGLLWNKEKGTIGTVDGLAKEFFVCGFVNDQKNKVQGFGELSESRLEGLREDQKKAFIEIYQSKDKIMLLEGGAGSGKSHLLKAITEAIKEKNIVVTATAPTSGATQNLTKDIGVKAETIQKILHKPGLYENVLKNGYLVVDEAGLLSLKQIEALFILSEKYNTQILLVGDTKQHHGVEAGDALRAIKTYTDICVARLTEIERQKLPEYREAVREIQNLNVQKGWDLFEKMGVIHSKDDYLSSLGTYINYEDLEKKLDSEKLYKTYLEKLDDGKSVIVVTPTRTEVQNLTTGLRKALKDRLGSEFIEKEVFASVRFTEAEKLNLSHYIARGNESHYVNFMSSANGFEKGSTWKVIEVQNDKATLENTKGGELKEFNPKEFMSNQFDIAERKTLEIKVGETLLLQKNDKVTIENNNRHEKSETITESFKFTNGELVRVKEIKDSVLILEDGRKINESVKNLDYGYVSTSYSAQGKTCDHVIVAMTNAGGRALSQEQFYVSTSRGREGIDIFVEDKEYIKTRIEAMGNRVLNIEMLPEKQKERIKNIRETSLDALKEASRNLAEKTAKEIHGEKSIIETVVEKTKSIAVSWREKLHEERNRQIEHHKDSIQVRIKNSRATIERRQFPLEKEFMPMAEKLKSKGKNMGMDKDI